MSSFQFSANSIIQQRAAIVGKMPRAAIYGKRQSASADFVPEVA
jgi:hypothetical protein